MRITVAKSAGRIGWWWRSARVLCAAALLSMWAAPALADIVTDWHDTALTTFAQTARLFALASLAAADAFIAVSDAKYAFNFWRPITTIRNGDGGDPGVLTWVPLVDTPLHPEYPCAHCIVAGAVATVLEAEFGTAPQSGMSMTSPTAPGVTRRWERFADIVDEISNARVWGGIHFRNSTRVGEQMGRAIGAYAVEQHLRAADGKAMR